MSDQKQQVIFIHGGMAFSRYEDFLAHLRTTPIDDPFTEPPKRWKNTLTIDLGEGFEVYTPSMPNKQNAKYEEWKLWFERYIPQLRDGVLLTGHSQGGAFLTKYLSEHEFPVSVRALILIAAPFGSDDLDLSAMTAHAWQAGGEDGGDFVPNPKLVPKLASRAEHVVIFHSTDDPVVPFAHALKYCDALPSAECVEFSDRGHFLSETFPEFISKLRELSRS